MEGKISTGLLSLDLRLDGGLPRGSMIEVFGPHSTGKSCLAIAMMARIEELGGTSVLFDLSNNFDIEFARNSGLVEGPTFYSGPQSAEATIEACKSIVESGETDLIVLDDLGCLAAENETPNKHVNQVIDQRIRSLVAALSKSNTCLLILNQIRTPFPKQKADHYTTPGGRMVKKYCSYRIQFGNRRSILDLDGINQIGNSINYKVHKKLGTDPYVSWYVDYYFQGGMDVEADIVTIALSLGVLTMSGNWIKYGDIVLGQGTRNAAKYLKKYPETKSNIIETIEQNQNN